MADFTINNSGTQNGTAATDDRLIYNISVAGGVTLSGISGSLASGYSGTFNGPTTNDGVFTGIEHFTFNDNVGGSDNITVGDGADLLNMGGGNDTANGAGGADTINTGSGSDTVFGGAGDDRVTLDVGGTDSIDGGADNDVLVISAASSALTMTASSISGPGTVAIVNIERFNVTGSGVGDSITTSFNDDTINGGAGNDTINSDGGQDSINAGTGSDTVNAAAGDDTIRVTLDGTDSINGGSGSDVLIVTNTVAGNITLSISSGSLAAGYNGTVSGPGTINFAGIERINFSTSGVGNDSILGGDGDDTISTNSGNDTIDGGGGDDDLDGGSGDDSLIGGEGLDSVYGGSGNDIIFAGVGNDSLYGEDGNDVMNGGDGNDDLYGGVGNDLMNAGSGSDNLYGGDGNDTLNAGTGLAAVDGGSGDDLIITGDEVNTLYGGTGNDTLDGGKGRDKIYGGDGFDTWIGDTSAVKITTVINLNYSTSFFQINGILKGIEAFNLTTGIYNDIITGHRTSAMDDIIRTAGGNDFIKLWLGGDDSVFGGVGHDYLTISGSSLTAGVTLSVSDIDSKGGCTGTVTDGTHEVNFAGVEAFRFTGAGNGDDSIFTANGNDTLEGMDGDDVLNSGIGQDRISGGNGEDTINGGKGDDRLYGGADADVFVFAKAAGNGRDRINDFENGSDKIRIAGETYAGLDISSVNNGEDTLIRIATGTTVLLEDVARSAINAGDFIFS